MPSASAPNRDAARRNVPVPQVGSSTRAHRRSGSSDSTASASAGGVWKSPSPAVSTCVPWRLRAAHLAATRRQAPAVPPENRLSR